MKNKIFATILIVSLLATILAGCDSLTSNNSGKSPTGPILASGVIEADRVAVSPEMGGKIAIVHVVEGDQVSAGDLVLSLEDDILLTQKKQIQAQFEFAVAQLGGADAAVDAAQAGLTSAEINLQAAKIQYQQILAQARSLEEPIRVDKWNESGPTQIEIPAWYFQQEEQISAAEEEVSNASDLYQTELKNYQDMAAEMGNGDFSKAETRLAEAQAAFDVAKILDDRQVGYEGREYLQDFIKTIYDQAEIELKAAQKAYDQILTDPDYKEILEARARVSVAEERYQIAQDHLDGLHRGEDSLEVMAAETLVKQAEAGVQQAESQITLAETQHQSAATAVQQAQASLDLINLQIGKLQIYSPITGIILTRTVEPGEVIAAGYTALSVGNLDQLTVTVYLPEDRYGQVKLGDKADLSVDSFPDDVFEAVVVRISDQAEYTPRNVQTQEERQTTVYAIKLSVNNSGGKLKPGMPADVVFNPAH